MTASPQGPEALLAAGMAALRARDMARACDLLRTAAQGLPTDRVPWIALANAELALGRAADAEAALDRQLALTPREVGALLLKGHLRQQGGDDRGASSFYRAALSQAAISGGIPPPLADLARRAQAFVGSVDTAFTAHLMEQVGSGLSPAMVEAIELLTGQRQVDLQQPSLFYFPGLPQRRFYDPAEFAWLAPMLDLLPAMQRELAGVMDGEAPGGEEGASATFVPYVHASADRPAPNNPLLDDPGWGAFYFWKDGAVVTDHAARCPATMEALALAPMPRVPGRAPMALWSRLTPGTHIAPHHGMLNTRLICHIPILSAPGCTLRVGSETRGWVDGVPLVFDDSIEHEARNLGPDPRVVLLFEIWRPEIGPEDRSAIATIFQAIDSYGEG